MEDVGVSAIVCLSTADVPNRRIPELYHFVAGSNRWVTDW